MELRAEALAPDAVEALVDLVGIDHPAEGSFG
jgi:hypothetical protein